MEIKFLTIVFTAVAIGVQCRSVELSNIKDLDEEAPANMSEQLRELIASYEKNFAKLVGFAIKLSRDKDNDRREIQFLNQLSSLIDQLTREQSKMNSMYANLDNETNFILQTPNNKPTMTSVNNVKDLIDYMKEIDIIYQDEDVTDEHIRIKRAAEGNKETASFTEERMTNMLNDIQHQLMQIYECLDKLCKKHHLTSTIISEETSNENIFPIGQSKKSIA
ncbi:uncharacterized protein [Anoplolepis gracilipes]|uniref:uncharacterized protein n=1 Tax=Anoplolepis gracilipes TaxID=354296 RepID=UPI003BA20EE5